MNDETMTCDCGAVLTDSDLDEYGEQCQACFDRDHFTCLECDSTDEIEHQSKSRPGYCVQCAADLAAEAA